MALPQEIIESHLPVEIHMSEDDRSVVKDLNEAPKEGASERVMANAARDNQSAPQALKEQQDKHEEMRREGRTPSSADLPSIALDGGLTSTVSNILDGNFDPSLVANDLTAKPQGDAKGDAKSDVKGDAPAGTKVDAAEAKKTAESIEDGFHWWKSDEFDKINKSLEGKTPEQIKAIDEEFKKTHDGKSIEQVLTERWGEDHPDKLEAAKKLLHPEGDKPAPKETPEEIKLRDGKALESIKNDPEVQKRHDELEKHAKATMKEPELGKFLDNMKKFEEREASMQREYQKEFESKGMKPEDAAKEAEKKTHEQIEKTYQNLDKLLAKNDKAPVSQADRVALAQQAMEHAADTKTISQGSYGTCYAAATETRTYAKDPAEATRLVADVATTGKYTSSGGVTVELDKNSLKRQGDAKDPPPKGDNRRDFASQLFEVTAINVELEKKNQSTNPPGKLRYEQHEYKPGSNPPPDDNGERLMNYATKPPTVEKKSFSLDPASTADMQKEISPSAGEGVTSIDSFQIAEMQKKILDIDMKTNGINDGKPVDTSDPEWAAKTRKAIEEKQGLDPKTKEEMLKEVNELEKTLKEDAKGNVVHVHNEQEMRDTLKKLKEEGKLPVCINVDTNNEPFWTDSKGGDAGGSGGPHVVTVTDYDPDTGKCTVQNQWDKAANHEVSAKQLFEATRMGDSLADLQKTAKESRDSGNPDYVKEYQILRFQKTQGKISSEEYDRKIAELSVERYKALKEGKIKNDDEYMRASREAALMVKQLGDSSDPADQARAQKIRDEVKKGMQEVDKAHP